MSKPDLWAALAAHDADERARRQGMGTHQNAKMLRQPWWITTARLCINPMREPQPLIIDALNDKTHMRYSDQRYLEHDLASEKIYLQRCVEKGVIALQIVTPNYVHDASRVVGSMTCTVDNGSVDLGILVLPQEAGKGFGTEAWRAVMQWWLNPLHGAMAKVTAGTADENRAMVAICRRAEMKETSCTSGYRFFAKEANP